MATPWEIEFGMGMGMPAAFGPVAAPAYIYGRPTAAEMLRVDDMLDLTQHDIHSSSSSSSSSLVTADASLLTATQFTVADISSNLECLYPHHASIAEDIYIPADEVAELEWLSKFVEDSFSDVPVQSLTPMETVIPDSIHGTGISAVVRGARSKRSRVMIAGAESSLAASAWSSLTPSSSATSSSSSSSDFLTPKGCNRKKQGAGDTGTAGGGMRRCTHCASDKTPQWRTGPLGPKTLCNACGVRFKSGRLVPEYRPAASPTFVLTQHSNSHRKVMELRRQKELLVLGRHDNAAITTDSGKEMMYSEYNVC